MSKAKMPVKRKAGLLGSVYGLGVWLFACMVVLAGFVVCGRCGYDNSDQSVQCRHCKATLKQVRPSGEEGSGGEGKGALSPDGVAAGEVLVPSDVIRAELKEAHETFREGDVEMARLLARNAAALDLLSEGKYASQIEALVSRCDTYGKRVKRKCGDCGGSGSASMRVNRLQGSSEEVVKNTGIKCVACRGQGYVMGEDTVTDQKFRIGRASNQYIRKQQAKKFVPIGGAWVPAAVESEISTLQSTQLKRMTAAPCPECLGIGREACKECKGRGTVRCEADGCENGKVTTEKAGELVKWQLRQQQICRTCRGRARVRCEDCSGRGSELCEECEGLGQRPQCSKCTGQGMVPCRKCGGGGTYKEEACPSCGGAGRSLCSSCSGDGREK